MCTIVFTFNCVVPSSGNTLTTCFPHSPNNTMYSLSACTLVAVFLQWKGFGPGYHHDRPEPGGPLKHYTHCMPLDWPPANMHRLIDQGIPPDAGQAVAIVKYGKTIANRFYTSHASSAHGFMYWCVTPLALSVQALFALLLLRSPAPSLSALP